MMTFKDGIAQIVKLVPTRFALIALPMGLMRVKSTLVNLYGGAPRASIALGPTQLAHGFITFRVINERLTIGEVAPFEYWTPANYARE